MARSWQDTRPRMNLDEAKVAEHKGGCSVRDRPGAMSPMAIVYGTSVSGDGASTDVLEVTVLRAGDHSGDELRVLRSWLSGVDKLRGRVRLAQPPPEPGKLGTLTDILVVTLGPAGAAAALAGALATWLRHRGSNVRVVVRGRDGRRIEVDVQRAKRMDPAGVSELAAELSSLLDGQAIESSSRDSAADRVVGDAGRDGGA